MSEITSWDTTASNNTSVGSVSIAEGWSPALVNNAIRAVMAAVAQGVVDGDFSDTSTGQPLDATLTALAALTIADGKLIKGTGADAFSQIDISSYGETLINLADAAALKSALGGVYLVSSTATVPGHLALDITGDGSTNFQMCWGIGTFGSSASFETAFPIQCYGVVPFFTSIVGQSDESDEHFAVTSTSTTGFTTTISGDFSTAPTFFYIAIGR